MKRTDNKSIYFYTLCGQVLQSVTTNPYLGVIFSEDLSFTVHIRNICAKASRTLGFLKRNLKSCPAPFKETAYISMCRSVLEYASPIWDLFLEGDKDQIEKIQRKAARFVTGDFRQRSSVTQMMKELTWEPLAERRTEARLILMYQIINGEVAVPVDPAFADQPTSHNTVYISHNAARIGVDPVVQSCRPRAAAAKNVGLQCRRRRIPSNDILVCARDLGWLVGEYIELGRRGHIKHLSHNYKPYQYSFYPRTIRDYNSLPATTRDCDTLDGFKSSLPPGSY